MVVVVRMKICLELSITMFQGKDNNEGNRCQVQIHCHNASPTVC